MTRVELPYFPDLTFGDRADLDDLMQQWFGKHLRSMDEPRLHSESIAETIRILTLPTFDKPTLVRIERHESCTAVTSKRTDGRGGYGPGRVTLDQISEHDASFFSDAKCLLNEIDYWNLPVLDDARVLDGTRQVIESNIDGKYHVIERADPNRNERRLIQWLYSQSTGLKIGG